MQRCVPKPSNDAATMNGVIVEENGVAQSARKTTGFGTHSRTPPRARHASSLVVSLGP